MKNQIECEYILSVFVHFTLLHHHHRRRRRLLLLFDSFFFIYLCVACASDNKFDLSQKKSNNKICGTNYLKLILSNHVVVDQSRKNDLFHVKTDKTDDQQLWNLLNFFFSFVWEIAGNVYMPIGLDYFFSTILIVTHFIFFFANMRQVNAKCFDKF